MSMVANLVCAAAGIAAAVLYLRQYLSQRMAGSTETGLEREDIWSSREKGILIAGAVMVLELSVWLAVEYPSNLIVDNIRLITLVSLILPCAITDYRDMIIPNMVILAGLGLRVILYLAELMLYSNGMFAILTNDLIGAGAILIFCLIGRMLVRDGLGMGDVKLLLILALFQGFTDMVSSLFFSLFIIFVAAIVLMITGKKTKKDTMPFAPAIFLGTWISIFMTGM